MINSGLRAYLLKERGQPGAQAFRSSWTCNGCAYAALQEFIRDLKAAGVLDQPQAQPDPGQPGSRALAFAGGDGGGPPAAGACAACGPAHAPRCRHG